MRSTIAQRLFVVVPLALMFLIVVMVYLPGLRGPFVFDDYSNIIDNPDIAVRQLDSSTVLNAALSGQSGPLKRPLAFASFALNYHFAGGFSNSLPFKITNLVIHLINVGLVYWLSYLLLATIPKRGNSGSETTLRWVPALFAALWAVHPLNLTSVLYVVQRMTSLSALFVLIGLIMFVYGRQQLQRSASGGLILLAIGYVVGLVLGLASKENAVLLPLFIIVIELTCFDWKKLPPPDRRRLLCFYAAAILAPLLFFVFWISARPETVSNAYISRDFTLPERLLTEGRVLWFYLRLIFAPNSAQLTLYHDDIAISSSLLSPWTTLPALIMWAVVLFLAIRHRKSHPVYSFAALWFLAGHVLESSFIGLEIAHEHRNYLPSIGPLLGLTYGIAAQLPKLGRFPMGIGLLPLIAIGFATLTYLRAHTWAHEDTIIEAMAYHHPRSAKSQTMLAELLLTRDNDVAGALLYYKQAMLIDSNDVGARLRIAMLTTHPAFAAQIDKDRDDGVEIKQISAGILSSPPDSSATPLSAKFLDELETILAERAMNADAREMLIRFSACIAEPPQQCAPLALPATRWYTAIVRNHRTDAVLRRHAILTLFEIAVSRKDYPAALKAADVGKEYEPAELTYDLMRANALILLGNYYDAQRILKLVMMTDRLSAGVAEDAAVLQKALDERLASGRAKSK